MGIFKYNICAWTLTDFVATYGQHLPSDLGSCTENIPLSPCPALLIAVTVIVTSGRLLFNPVTLRKLSTVVTTAFPSIGGGDIDTS